MLKGFLELSKEVLPGSKGYGSAGDSILLEGIGPGQGGSFGHIQEGEGNFLHVSIIGCLIDR